MIQDTFNNREIKMGVELEVPFAPENGRPMAVVGEPSNGADPHEARLPAQGEITHEWIAGSRSDKLYGIEVRTPYGGIPAKRLSGWYRDTYRALEKSYGKRIEPTGLYGESSAGLHTHISPISEQKALRLAELSTEPWMQIFTATTLASFDVDGRKVEQFEVSRAHFSRHVTMKYGSRHKCVVNKHRSGGDGHYEWRLPEPMLPEHFELVADFLRTFVNNSERAIDNAKSLVMEGNSNLTAFKRADEIGPDLRKEASRKSEATDLLVDIIQ